MTPGAESTGNYPNTCKHEHKSEYNIPDSHQRIFRRPRINADNDTEVGSGSIGSIPLSLIRWCGFFNWIEVINRIRIFGVLGLGL